MASTQLPVFALLLAALARAQNNSPEDGGGSSSPSSTSPSPSAQPSNEVNNEAGASGSGNAYSISTGGMIALIVVVVIVVLLGISSSVLFYIAKKRQWEVRKTIKRASKRIVSKVDLRQSKHQSRPKGMVRMNSPTRSKDIDLEKGTSAKDKVKVDPKSKRQAMQIDDTNTKPAAERKYKTTLPESWTVGGKK